MKQWRRAGFALVEALVAGTLTGLLLLALAALLIGVARMEALQSASAGTAETLRVATHVLGRELEAAAPADFVVGPDSVRLRAFRGIGVRCAAAASGGVIAYRGLRAPDPAKDSVLVLRADGAEVVEGLLAADATASGCGRLDEPTVAYRLSLGGDLPPGAVVLVFERGTYSLGGDALRYRRGAAGRQPLTATNLDDDSSGFVAGAAGRLFSARFVANERPRHDVPEVRREAVLRLWREPEPPP